MGTTTLLRLATAGSVDDGKSTLIGRLLFDSKGVFDDQWAAVARTSQERGHDYTDLSLLTDGLRAEREQGITIDVAYRYFATPRRKFIIADTPGHTQYTRNMVTGASTAHLAIILLDARKGLLEQSRRHACLSSLLGIRHVVLAVNKMDLVGWDRATFESVREEFAALAVRLGIPDVVAIPLSALNGDNVVTRSQNTPWYDGPTLLDHLESVSVVTDSSHDKVRFPVQYVIRPHSHEHHDHRSYAGTLAGGIVRTGDEVVALPSGLTSRIATIEGPAGPTDEAFAPMAISITLSDDIDLSRGDMLTHVRSQPRVSREVEATICWMSDVSDLAVGTEVLVKHTTRTTKATVTALQHRLDVTTLEEDSRVTSLAVNEIGRIKLRTRVPLLLDDYASNPSTGSFILIDPVTSGTVAAGMVVPPSATPDTTPPPSLVESGDRVTAGATLWFTGLSGAGKSTVALLMEKTLLEQGRPAFVLDGDTLRQGLNSDLGFSAADRAENLRRLAHVAALMASSGQVVLVSAISPLEAHRRLARQVHADLGLPFVEVYVDTPIEVCEERDPKGLYAKARRGELADLTGVDSPFEPPVAPDVRLSAGTPAEHVARLIEMLPRG